ncbi:hypothetical protein LZ31DRAFT_324913 [Colletotrichum somersetense]|nr:hypothetical protein LZ31DRAFT_324913 [Colletotrichum somersetense]
MRRHTPDRLLLGHLREGPGNSRKRLASPAQERPTKGVMILGYFCGRSSSLLSRQEAGHRRRVRERIMSKPPSECVCVCVFEHQEAISWACCRPTTKRSLFLLSRTEGPSNQISSLPKKTHDDQNHAPTDAIGCQPPRRRPCHIPTPAVSAID